MQKCVQPVVFEWWITNNHSLAQNGIVSIMQKQLVNTTTWSSRCSMLRLGVPKVQSSKVPSSNVQSSKVPIFQVPIFQVPKFQGPIGKFQRSKFQSSKVPRFKEFSTRTTSLFHYVTGRHYAKSAFLPSSKVPTFQVPKFQVPSFSLRGEKAEEG